jgi:hypothetical protein
VPRNAHVVQEVHYLGTHQTFNRTYPTMQQHCLYTRSSPSFLLRANHVPQNPHSHPQNPSPEAAPIHRSDLQTCITKPSRLNIVRRTNLNPLHSNPHSGVRNDESQAMPSVPRTADSRHGQRPRPHARGPRLGCGRFVDLKLHHQLTL